VRNDAIGFSIGNKGYIGGGGNNFESFKDFWQYDPNTNVWTQIADFDGGKIWGAASFGIGSKGYVGTGTTAYDTRREDFWEYDPALNKWTRKADFPGGGRTRDVGFSIGNKGYVGTGLSGQCCTFFDHKDFWEYDPAKDAWTRKADFEGGLRSGAIGFCINGKGYIGTGGHDNKYFGDILGI
jgi:N-acetylneuraminic acid mutarotase